MTAATKCNGTCNQAMETHGLIACSVVLCYFIAAVSCSAMFFASCHGIHRKTSRKIFDKLKLVPELAVY